MKTIIEKLVKAFDEANEQYNQFEQALAIDDYKDLAKEKKGKEQ